MVSFYQSLRLDFIHPTRPQAYGRGTRAFAGNGREENLRVSHPPARGLWARQEKKNTGGPPVKVDALYDRRNNEDVVWKKVS